MMPSVNVVVSTTTTSGRSFQVFDRGPSTRAHACSSRNFFFTSSPYSSPVRDFIAVRKWSISSASSM